MEMSILLSKKYDLTTNDITTVQIKLLDEIQVYTDVYSYDLFSLIVDLGSALGLWLGLSALGILDNLVLVCQNAVRKLSH